jgi:hypothetical protein
MPGLAINMPGNHKELKNHPFPVCPVWHLCCWRIAAGRYFLLTSLLARAKNANILICGGSDRHDFIKAGSGTVAFRGYFLNNITG